MVWIAPLRTRSPIIVLALKQGKAGARQVRYFRFLPGVDKRVFPKCNKIGGQPYSSNLLLRSPVRKVFSIETLSVVYLSIVGSLVKASNAFAVLLRDCDVSAHTSPTVAILFALTSIICASSAQGL